MTRPELVLVRHGETEWNREGRHQGHGDSRLTPLGEAQARAAGRLLKDLFAPLDRFAIHVSPLGRTRRTATLVCEAAGLNATALTYDDRLREKCYGTWEGSTLREIEVFDAEGVAAQRRDPWGHRPPGGETLDEVMVRVERWLAELDPARPVIAVSHGGAGRALQRAYLGLTAEETLAIEMRQDVIFHLTAHGMRMLETAPA